MEQVLQEKGLKLAVRWENVPMPNQKEDHLMAVVLEWEAVVLEEQDEVAEWEAEVQVEVLDNAMPNKKPTLRF